MQIVQYLFMASLKGTWSKKNFNDSLLPQVQSAARRAQITTDETMWTLKCEKAVEHRM